MSFEIGTMRSSASNEHIPVAIAIDADDPGPGRQSRRSIDRFFPPLACNAPSATPPDGDLLNVASNMISGRGQQLPEFDCEEIAKTLTAAYRWHPHFSNVLTHICGSQWTKIEAAMRSIVDPAARWADLSPLSQNLVELMWAERGVTGRILKPYLREFVAQKISPRASDRLLRHLAHLCPKQKKDAVQYGEEHPAEISGPIAEKACA
jgi:hypothetical protein